MREMSEICVVHLVRARYGLDPLDDFLKSYQNHQAGIAHDWMFIFKGFEGLRLPTHFEAVVAGLPHESLFITDDGVDINAYFLAAGNLQQKYLCFLNSFSVVQDDSWLRKMHENIATADVGVVGATGSWESNYTTLLQSAEYASLPESVLSVSRCLVADYSRRLLPRRSTNSKNLRSSTVDIYRRAFPAFPNYHVRTNGFMIRRDLFLRLDFNGKSKWDALEFESGWNSLTRQLLKLGLKPAHSGKGQKSLRADALAGKPHLSQWLARESVDR